MAGRRVRLDAELLRRHLAPSRTAARRMIDAGEVVVDGIAVAKPASQVTADQTIRLVDRGPKYASRGGLKLHGALDDLGIDVSGASALDAGAAHGGFTDVLLRRGARMVVAVDVAYGQFDWALRNDDRVRLLERTNVRNLDLEHLGGVVVDLVVADLSFISLTKVLPAFSRLAGPTATLIPMVKPQFEAGRGSVGKNGVVRDPAVWHRTMADVVLAAHEHGFELRGAAPSQAPGPAGNIEFFLHLRRDDGHLVDPARPVDDDLLGAAVERGARLAG